MADAVPLICVALVAVALVIGWVLGRRRASGGRGGDLVGDQLAARRPAPLPRPAELEYQVRVLLVRQQKIQAIKLVREVTGADLKAAKDAVDRFSIGQPLWLASSGPPEVAGPDLDRVRALKRQGRLIEAIKEYRALTGLGLKESKDAVDLL